MRVRRRGANISVIIHTHIFAQAQDSYVAGFPVPLPLPPGPIVRLECSLVSYMSLAHLLLGVCVS